MRQNTDLAKLLRKLSVNYSVKLKKRRAYKNIERGQKKIGRAQKEIEERAQKIGRAVTLMSHRNAEVKR